MSFERQYDSKYDEFTAAQASYLQSDLRQNAIDTALTKDKNIDTLLEYEDHNAVVLPDGQLRPDEIDQTLVESQIKEKLDEYEKEDPVSAELLRNYIFDKEDDVAEAWASKLDHSEVKIYPGSPKGPNPEDDPFTYSQWFYDNQPKSMYPDGPGTGREFGMKLKKMRTKDDLIIEAEQQPPALEDHAYMTIFDYFFDNIDEKYPLHTYEGIPENAINDEEEYYQGNDNYHLTFSGQRDVGELPLVPPNYTLYFHYYMTDMEKWTLYRGLPKMIKFARGWDEFWNDIAKGYYRGREVSDEVKIPSIWTYYNTLPGWARENPIVKNLAFALEYHKPHMDWRQKEIALNLACTYLRPIEGRLKDVIVEIAASRKLRVNMENAKDMMTELRFYEIDIGALGSDTEPDYGNDNQDSILALLSKGMDEENAKHNPLAKMLEGLNRDERSKERSKYTLDELNVSEFQVEPQSESCLTDFPLKPYADVDEIHAQRHIDNEH